LGLLFGPLCIVIHQGATLQRSYQTRHFILFYIFILYGTLTEFAPSECSC